VKAVGATRFTVELTGHASCRLAMPSGAAHRGHASNANKVLPRPGGAASGRPPRPRDTLTGRAPSLDGGDPALTASSAGRLRKPSAPLAQIVFRPDWTRHAKAAPFKRNDAMLEALPIGVVVCPGTGIQENLADKARKLGIPVWRFGGA
jgi:hypothetical protein